MASETSFRWIFLPETAHLQSMVGYPPADSLTFVEGYKKRRKVTEHAIETLETAFLQIEIATTTLLIHKCLPDKSEVATLKFSSDVGTRADVYLALETTDCEFQDIKSPLAKEQLTHALESILVAWNPAESETIKARIETFLKKEHATISPEQMTMNQENDSQNIPESARNLIGELRRKNPTVQRHTVIRNIYSSFYQTTEQLQEALREAQCADLATRIKEPIRKFVFS